MPWKVGGQTSQGKEHNTLKVNSQLDPFEGKDTSFYWRIGVQKELQETSGGLRTHFTLWLEVNAHLGEMKGEEEGSRHRSQSDMVTGEKTILAGETMF